MNLMLNDAMMMSSGVSYDRNYEEYETYEAVIITPNLNEIWGG